MYDYVGAQPSPAQVEEGEGRQAVEVGGHAHVNGVVVSLGSWRWSYPTEGNLG